MGGQTVMRSPRYRGGLATLDTRLDQSEAGLDEIDTNVAQIDVSLA